MAVGERSLEHLSAFRAQTCNPSGPPSVERFLTKGTHVPQLAAQFVIVLPDPIGPVELNQQKWKEPQKAEACDSVIGPAWRKYGGQQQPCENPTEQVHTSQVVRLGNFEAL